MKSAYIGTKRLELAGKFGSPDELIEFLKKAYTADKLELDKTVVYGSTSTKVIVNKLSED